MNLFSFVAAFITTSGPRPATPLVGREQEGNLSVWRLLFGRLCRQPLILVIFLRNPLLTQLYNFEMCLSLASQNFKIS